MGLFDSLIDIVSSTTDIVTDVAEIVIEPIKVVATESTKIVRDIKNEIL